MDILLTHGHFLSSDPAEQRIMRPYVPLGILSIGAYLESRCFAASVFDTTFESMESFAGVIRRMKPPVVGLYVNMMTKATCLAMIRTARASGAKVIVGGPEPVHYAAEFLDLGADVVVTGEGELTVAELLAAQPWTPERLTRIAGIIFKDGDGTVLRTDSRPLIPDLDSLPFPDRSKVDLGRYLNAWTDRHGLTSLSLITMRGCPFTCRWCSHAVYGESYRRRSPARTVEEIEVVLSRYHPDQFWFADDVFTINHPWLFDFERELSRRNLRIAYECITRADRMNEAVIRALKSTGCRRVWIGSESGSQRVLDAMDRRVTVEQIQAMTRLSQRHGIEVGMFVMLGYPGETRDDIEATIRHLKAARPEHVLTTVAYPIRGTAFYEEMRGHMEIPSLPFAEWNDRMIHLSGRFPKRFYWFANRRVVNEATVSRQRVSPGRRWGLLAQSYLRAKAAHLGMTLSA
jgi:anaerobic magnesium-protoporphyrin IX monomethyl ester cyclase